LPMQSRIWYKTHTPDPCHPVASQSQNHIAPTDRPPPLPPVCDDGVHGVACQSTVAPFSGPRGGGEPSLWDERPLHLRRGRTTVPGIPKQKRENLSLFWIPVVACAWSQKRPAVAIWTTITGVVVELVLVFHAPL
jgi:hypothetical protein